MLKIEDLDQISIDKPMSLDSITGNIVDIVNRRVYDAQINITDGYIKSISPSAKANHLTIIPPFIDAHVHVESSMIVPYEFARSSIINGVIASVSDPHEIANVLGLEGIRFMIDDAKRSPFRFIFGAPSCVPATSFDTSGGEITPSDIDRMFNEYSISYLSEMMNFPGVINDFPDVIEKINIAKKSNKLIDGHAPNLTGQHLDKYIHAGISTDHETTNYEEGKEKLYKGMKLLIREGSSAKNLDTLSPLINEFPESCMFCSDDLHPDDLINGSINLSVKRLIKRGYDIYTVLRCASYNVARHYRIDIGFLQQGQRADFLIIDNLDNLNILATVIGGNIYAFKGNILLPYSVIKRVNNFNCAIKKERDIQVPAEGDLIRVIEVIDGQILTKKILSKAKIKSGFVVSDTDNDILKIVLVNRYKDQKPSIAFTKNFGLKKGAIGSSVSHDSHNIIAVGVDDKDIVSVINKIIEHKGGLAVSDGQSINILPLPIAGLMSDRDAYFVAEQYKKIDTIAKKLGSSLQSPLMTLSFLALLVIPEIKISLNGLFDVNSFQTISLFEGK